MRCPYCSFSETKVIDSRLNQTGDSTRRRRVCPRCEGRFTTYERIEEVMPLVIKKDGRREPYAREKLKQGLEKACQKRAIPSQRIDEIVSSIEKRLQSYGLKEVPTKTVGGMIMAELHKLDKVAYVRFASVYRDFKDVDEFVAELQEPPTPDSDPAAPLFSFANPPENTP
ncbi:MAG: transcriptional repressor NrdR [Cryobacterium sp.]|nr:transcriptional repressor NrdR [Oligoflexia bacterium]